MTSPAVGTRTALTVTGLSTLAAATFVASAAYTANTNKPWDVICEVAAATTNTPDTSTGQQILVYIQESLDGTNFRSGPTSGTNITDVSNLKFAMTLPLASSATTERATFSVAQLLGYCPYAFKVILYNDLGVALTSGTVFTAEITG